MTEAALQLDSPEVPIHAAMAVADDHARVVPIGLIDESPTNPRTHFDTGKLAELAESILRHGVLQPILVRPRGGRYELVAGHRRFRAARSIPIEVIPAIVQELTDQEVLEVQVVENLQRADLHPLEEAEGYARLLRDFGYDADSLASKIGKSRSYVYGRIKLAELCDSAKKALWDGKISHSIALLIARIPDAKVQKDASAELLNHVDGVTFREAARIIDHRFLLKLEEASWKLDDEALVPEAGPCTTCPFRSGNQDFVGETRSADICTSPQCYRTKADAMWQRTQAAALERGDSVLSKAETGKVFDRYGRLDPGSKYATLDGQAYDYGIYGKTYRTLLGKKFIPPIVVAREPESGKAHALVRKTDLAKAMKAAGVSKPASGSTNDYSAQQRAEAEQRKLERAIEARVISELQPKLASIKLTTALLRVLGKSLAFDRIHAMEEVFKRRGLKWPGYNQRAAAVVKFVDGLTDGEIVLMGAELSIGFRNLEQRTQEEKNLVWDLAALVGVDAPAINKRMRAEAATKKKLKEAKAKAAEAKRGDAVKPAVHGATEPKPYKPASGRAKQPVKKGKAD